MSIKNRHLTKKYLLTPELEIFVVFKFCLHFTQNKFFKESFLKKN